MKRIWARTRRMLERPASVGDAYMATLTLVAAISGSIIAAIIGAIWLSYRYETTP